MPNRYQEAFKRGQTDYDVPLQTRSEENAYRTLMDEQREWLQKKVMVALESQMVGLEQQGLFLVTSRSEIPLRVVFKLIKPPHRSPEACIWLDGSSYKIFFEGHDCDGLVSAEPLRIGPDSEISREVEKLLEYQAYLLGRLIGFDDEVGKIVTYAEVLRRRGVKRQEARRH
jgi:hypothetical protein